MKPVPDTKSLSERFVSFFVAVLAGAIALSLAATLVVAVLPVLLVAGAVVGGGLLAYRWWQGRSGW